MSKHKRRLKAPLSLSGRQLIIGGGIFVAAVLAVVAWQHRDNLSDEMGEFIARTINSEVQHILVEGATHTDPKELKDIIGLKKGDPLVGFSVVDIRENIEALPWVEVANVSRKLPSTVKVQVYEHQPIARLKLDDAEWVINKEGLKIVKATDEDTFNDLPLLTGEGAQDHVAELFALLTNAGQGAYIGQIKGADYIGQRRWDLHFKSGVSVQLPEKQVADSLKVLENLQEKRQILDMGKGVVVDLRLEDRITLRLPENMG